MARVGVLALQGAFREHRAALERLGAQVAEVRLAADLDGLHGLILPGGESTTMARLMTEYALWEPLRAFHARGGQLWGTCAGPSCCQARCRAPHRSSGGRTAWACWT